MPVVIATKERGSIIQGSTFLVHVHFAARTLIFAIVPGAATIKHPPNNFMCPVERVVAEAKGSGFRA